MYMRKERRSLQSPGKTKFPQFLGKLQPQEAPQRIIKLEMYKLQLN